MPVRPLKLQFSVKKLVEVSSVAVANPVARRVAG
jgi:hypothetical protein